MPSPGGTCPFWSSNRATFGGTCCAPPKDRSVAIAEAAAGLTGNALKDLIYQRLVSLMDRPYREVIR
jgi:hypothetical protein